MSIEKVHKQGLLRGDNQSQSISPPGQHQAHAPPPPTPVLHSLYPLDTQIKDFGYAEEHPLRTGRFAKPLVYDGIEVHGLNSADSDDEYDYDGEGNDYANYNPYISPVNRQIGVGRGVVSLDSIYDYDDSHNNNNSTNKDLTNNEFNDYNEADDDRRGEVGKENSDYEAEERHLFSSDEINRKAIALFDFTPENDNEVGLTAGQLIWISYRHGQGWLVAEDPESGENGLVPEEYVEIYYDKQEVIEDIPKPFLPAMLQSYDHYSEQAPSDDTDSEWVDTEYEEERDEDEADEVSEALGTTTISESP